MARYLLTSFNKEGAPYYGAIYTDGKIVKMWGTAYTRMFCESVESDLKTGFRFIPVQPLVIHENVEKEILNGMDLRTYWLDNPLEGFEVEELEDSAPDKETLDRLDGLEYE